MVEPQVVGLGKVSLALSLIGQSNKTVKQAEGLILIEGYTAGNNRQLAVHQPAMRLGFADNRLRRGEDPQVKRGGKGNKGGEYTTFDHTRPCTVTG